MPLFHEQFGIKGDLVTQKEIFKVTFLSISPSFFVVHISVTVKTWWFTLIQAKAALLSQQHSANVWQVRRTACFCLCDTGHFYCAITELQSNRQSSLMCWAFSLQSNLTPDWHTVFAIPSSNITVYWHTLECPFTSLQQSEKFNNRRSEKTRFWVGVTLVLIFWWAICPTEVVNVYHPHSAAPISTQANKNLFPHFWNGNR